MVILYLSISIVILIGVIRTIILVKGGIPDNDHSEVVLADISAEGLVVLFNSEVVVTASVVDSYIVRTANSDVNLREDVTSDHAPRSKGETGVQEVHSELVYTSVTAVILVRSAEVYVHVILVIRAVVSELCVDVEEELPSAVLPDYVEAVTAVE